ncbi:MAG: hypothetical protein H0Z39_06650 [Peptococcaceae bacterium]|nr:hypothetical protein [Peptococcaceae bacterium]
MASLVVDMGPAISANSIDKLKETINKVGPNDQLVVSMEAADAHEADAVLEILRKKGFNYQAKGSHDGRTYRVIATRLQGK